jgi:hypothetical protein
MDHQAIEGGLQTPIKLTKVLYTTNAGVELIWTPITPALYRAVLARSFETYPDPDPTPFEKEKEDAFTPGDMTDPNDDPEYVRLSTEAMIRREGFVKSYLIENHVNSLNRSELLTVYREDIEAAKKIFDNITYTDWYILLTCFLLTDRDIGILLNGVMSRLPLTQKEVSETYEYFRYGSLLSGAATE